MFFLAGTNSRFSLEVLLDGNIIFPIKAARIWTWGIPDVETNPDAVRATVGRFLWTFHVKIQKCWEHMRSPRLCSALWLLVRKIGGMYPSWPLHIRGNAWFSAQVSGTKPILKGSSNIQQTCCWASMVMFPVQSAVQIIFKNHILYLNRSLHSHYIPIVSPFLFLKSPLNHHDPPSGD